MRWLNGRLVPAAEALVSVDDLGFRYGAGCMETMRWQDGGIFRLGQHLARLDRGLSALGVEAPPEAALRAAVRETVEANALTAARVRIIVTPGRGRSGPSLAGAGPPTVLIAADPAAPDGAGDGAPEPIPARLAVGSPRVSAGRLLAGAKHQNYLPMLLALTEARALDADEALLRTDDDRIVEGATTNLFVVTAGTVRTPPLADGPLPGVTRAAVIEVAAMLGIACVEETLRLPDLAAADEWLLTNAVVGVRPVAALLPPDGAPLIERPAPGPISGRLAAGYGDLCARERER